MGLFDKLKQGLKKTTQLLNTDVRDLFKSEGRLVDDAFLDELLGDPDQDRHGRDAAAGRSSTRSRTQFRARVVQMDDVLGQHQGQAQGS